MVGRFNNPAAEVVRFAANPDVSFPASEIQSLEQREGEAPLMRVNFMGCMVRREFCRGPIANW